MKKKILLVFGTRPEAIKMCPVVKELKTRECFDVATCVTAQHREMLDQVLLAFDVKPEYDLNIMKDKQSLSDITVAILSKMDAVIDDFKPDIVLVHGDTTTGFVTALSCFYKQVPIAHVEAGLRTHNIRLPFPEEFNRRGISLMSDIDFAPTETAKQNLLREGKPEDKIFVTGNTGIDALRTTVKEDYTHPILEKYKSKKIILITAHRRESIGEPMENMFGAINRVLMENDDLAAIYPVHLNPAVKAIAEKVFGDNDRIELIEPLDVMDFHNFMNRAYLVLTDSGGIQEEAPSLGKPVLVMRNETERPEGIAAGTLKLVGTDEKTIYENFDRIIHDAELYKSMSNASNPYGDGFASVRIGDILEGEL